MRDPRRRADFRHLATFYLLAGLIGGLALWGSVVWPLGIALGEWPGEIDVARAGHSSDRARD